MGRQTSSSKGFQCRFDSEGFSATLDRDDQHPQAVEARLVRHATHGLAIGSGCLVFVERNESPNALADRLIREFQGLSPVALSEVDLAAFKEVAVNWLAFNFRLTIESK